jgi:hypothetical protein
MNFSDAASIGHTLETNQRRGQARCSSVFAQGTTPTVFERDGRGSQIRRTLLFLGSLTQDRLSR